MIGREGTLGQGHDINGRAAGQERRVGSVASIIRRGSQARVQSGQIAAKSRKTTTGSLDQVITQGNKVATVILAVIDAAGAVGDDTIL